MSAQPFVLNSELVSHSADVRCVCSIGYTADNDLKIASSSRDQTVKIWSALSGQLQHTLTGHSHFVASVITIPSSPFFPSPTIASAGNDKLINLWDIQKEGPIMTLLGHTDTVCALGLTNQGELISGSWDKTARIWKGPESYTTLTGHAHAVWTVLGLPNGDVVTGSADHTIKIWRAAQCVATLTKHKDCVRGLALVPNVGFVSCGNDGVLYLWSFAGECLQEMHGHEAYVYSVAVLQSGELISGGEDRALMVWKDGQLIQSIKHPGSVWSVAALPNGEIVTGCSDGMVRIWTRNVQRIASQSLIQSYEKSVTAAQVVPGGNESVGGISLSKLPGLDALQFPGSRHGDNRIVRNGNVAEAYQWDAHETQWNKLGEVVTQPDSEMDKQYDHVFDVDIGDGKIRKLGYNNHENPFLVAQEFLVREELDQGWLDTVAQFIIKNATPVTIGESTAISDPFTGSHRYVSAEENTSGPTAPSKPTFQHFPLQSPVVFDTANFTAVLTKIQEFNAELVKGGHNDKCMNKTEEEKLVSLVRVLSETTRYHISTVTDADIALLCKLMEWPATILFPVLDIARLTVLHPAAAKKIAPTLFPLVLRTLSKDYPANLMLALRFVVNMFRWELPRSVVSTRQAEILDQVADAAQSDNKNVKLALATLVLNFSWLFHQHQQQSSDGKLQCMSILSEILGRCNDQDTEVVYRCFVALGTLLWNDAECQQLLTDLDSMKYVNAALSSNGKVAECAKELKQYTKM